MFTRGWHFTRPPYLMLDGNDDDAGGGGGEDSAPKFPANTPVKDMTPEQQAAYHQHQARKHENRVKGFGEWTPEKIRALEQERDTLKTAGQTDADKAIEAARAEGRAEGIAEANKVKATYALDKALQGRVPEATALLGLDVTKFIVNGQVDDVAVKAWVDDHSEEAAAVGQQRKNIDLGAGRRDAVKTTPGDRGRGEAARRFKKTDS